MYQANTPQARFLVAVCAEAGSLALPFGEKVLKAALGLLKGTAVDRQDPRGLLLGFHSKALEVLLGLRAATRVGSLGPAMLGARVLFETYLQQRFILQGDLRQKANIYRLAGIDDTLKDTRERILTGDATGENFEMLFDVGRARSVMEQATRTSVMPGTVQTMANKVGLGRFYANLYRMASSIAHASDGDLYNPILIEAFASDTPRDQPYFLTGFGLWGVGDAVSLASFVDVVPLCLFGATARFFGVPIEAKEREIVDLFQSLIDRDDVGGVQDLRKSYPDLFAARPNNEMQRTAPAQRPGRRR